MARNSRPPAAELFAGLPPARHDGARLRAATRAMRSAAGLALGVIDDDPTGSQCVHGVQVVLTPAQDAVDAALDTPAAVCFVLTNSRSAAERAAAELTIAAARSLHLAAARRGARLQLVSRSDSTLRGHVLAEVRALAAAQRAASGRGPDAVLLVPAFIEAGRLTAGDIHWARTGQGLVPVGETEFARDRMFGYSRSDLREFVAEKSGGQIAASQVASIGLADIRLGGPDRVRDLLAGLRDATWVVVNATEYSDLETVACGMLLAADAGSSFLLRTGPSFVRALAGIEPKEPLRGLELLPPAGAGRQGRAGGHGLVVAGSHVAQTNRQLAALRAGGGIAAVELDVAAVAAGGRGAVTAAARAAATALRRSDVLVCTSRDYVPGRGSQDAQAVGQAVAAALARITRQALTAEPAWIVAKGGITAHDVAAAGLGIRRAEVAGQMFPGLVSVWHPADAEPEAMGVPYVVFPGNVGDDQALAAVVALLRDGAGGRGRPAGG